MLAGGQRPGGRTAGARAATFLVGLGFPVGGLVGGLVGLRVGWLHLLGAGRAKVRAEGRDGASLCLSCVYVPTHLA